MGLTRHIGRRVAVTAVAGSSILMLIAPRAIADPSEALRPNGRGQTVSEAAKTAGPKQTSNGITYHGGPLQTGPITIVPIWYGAGWTTGDGPSKQALVTDFLQNLGASSYFKINTTYKNASGQTPLNQNFAVNAGYTDTSYSQGKSVSDAGVQAEVAKAMSAVGVSGPNVQYAFFGDNTTTLSSGYGTSYCGWHTYGTVNGVDTMWQATIDTPSQWMSACAMQTTSPNGLPGTDAMLSVVAHEVEETATDMHLNAWFDSRGYENADKCAWTFGTTSTASNGSKYNLVLNGKQYLIQRNWVNASGGYCAMSIS